MTCFEFLQSKIMNGEPISCINYEVPEKWGWGHSYELKEPDLRDGKYLVGTLNESSSNLSGSLNEFVGQKIKVNINYLIMNRDYSIIIKKDNIQIYV